jgi:thymidylate synthase (FAD)
MQLGAERKSSPPYSEQEFLAAQDETWRDLTRSRERDECREKLVTLGLLRAE